jgi:hypothetical protein
MKTENLKFEIDGNPKPEERYVSMITTGSLWPKFPMAHRSTVTCFDRQLAAAFFPGTTQLPILRRVSVCFSLVCTKQRGRYTRHAEGANPNSFRSTPTQALCSEYSARVYSNSLCAVPETPCLVPHLAFLPLIRNTCWKRRSRRGKLNDRFSILISDRTCPTDGASQHSVHQGQFEHSFLQ